MTSVLVLGKNSLTSGGIRYSLLFLTTTKLTGNEYYCYKIEGQGFFTFTWLNFEPSSRHLHLFYRNKSRFTDYNVRGSRVYHS